MRKMMPFLAISLAVSALSAIPVQAQMPPPGDMRQPLLQVKVLEQEEEAQQAVDARTNLQSYSQRVAEYIDELQERCTETHAYRGKVETRVSELKKTLPDLPADKREQAKTELDSLKNWLTAESGMAAQAEKNVRLCQQWLAYERAEVNNAEYSAAEAQQQIADEQLKLRQAQSELERQQRMLQDQQYWDARNDDGYYGYGGYPRVGGFGRGYGYGYTSHGPVVHSSGGGGGGGGAMHVGGGGGHGGGHR